MRRAATRTMGIIASVLVARECMAVLPLVPWPKSVKEGGGALELKPPVRIAAASKALEPLAAVLQDEVARVAGVQARAVPKGGAGVEIVLTIDPSLVAEGKYFPYKLSVGERIEVRGADYAAVAQGTASLLQLLARDARGVSVPKVEIEDWSPAPYPGMMVDVARQKNTLEDLKDSVNLCRLYKVRYLHLHLNDMEGFVFPSKLFPKLGTHQRGAHGGPAPEVYPREQFVEFLRYADERGVSVVPELETVFHTGSMMSDMPDVFGGPGVLNMVSEKMYEALEALIGEMCEVFASSPYFHIGCDEASIAGISGMPTYKAYLAAHKLSDLNDVYRFHIQRLNQVIKKHGKQTIVWQDCPLPDDKDIIVMAWRIDYNHGPTAGLISEGRPVIQVTWTPPVYGTVKEVFDWRPFDSVVKPGPLGYGSQMVLWEMQGAVAVPYLRYKMPPRQERTYSPDAERNYEDFCARLSENDATLDTLISGIAVRQPGLMRPPALDWMLAGGRDMGPTSSFVKALELSMSSGVPGGTIHYTTDGSEPTRSSPKYGMALRLEKFTNDAVTVRARLYDSRGKALGGKWSRTYRWEPFAVNVKGTIAAGDNRFGKAASLELGAVTAGGTVRYEVGGPVTQASPAMAKKPLVLTNSCEISMAFFDAAGKTRGSPWKQRFEQVDFDPSNMTYKKPVTTSGNVAPHVAGFAVDGLVSRDETCAFSPAPQWATVDLEKEETIGKVTLYTYWDGRFYQYRIELSGDGKTWTEVGDGSKNTTPATEKGYTHAFEPRKARYIRVTMLHNSANVGVHIAEIRAWPSDK